MKSALPNPELPQEVVWELLAVVRNQFCPEMGDGAWFQSLRMFKRVVCYPAAELARAGVSLPPERYRARLLEVLTSIKRHGDTGNVHYWPGYLLKCVKEHWAHHGEDWLQEGKSIRTRAEAVLLATGRAAERGTGPDMVEVLAATYAALSSPGAGRKKRPPKVREQGELNLL